MQKNVLITGVGRGLGKALAERFLDAGYRVYGLMRQKDQAKQFASADFIPLIADVSDDNCEDAIRSVMASLPLHLLINNAGIGGRSAKLSQVKPQDMLRLFNTHCVGVLRVTRAVLPNLSSMPQAGIININSRMGSVSAQYSRVYSHLQMTYEYRVAKAAQNMLSACLRNELPANVSIYQLHPGRIKSGTAQTDAVLTPAEAASNIYRLWEKGLLNEGQGIIDSELGNTYAW